MTENKKTKYVTDNKKAMDMLGMSLIPVSGFVIEKFGAESAVFLAKMMDDQSKKASFGEVPAINYDMEELKNIFYFFSENKIKTLIRKFKKNGILITDKHPETSKTIIGVDSKRFDELVYGDE